MTYILDKELATLGASDRKLLKKYKFTKEVKNNRVLRYLWSFKKLFNLKRTSEVKTSSGIEKLIIIFRHVYINSDQARFPSKARPEGFDHLKCFINLVESIRSSEFSERIQVHLFYNGTRLEFEKDPISSYVADCGLDVKVKLNTAKSALESVLIMWSTLRLMPFQPNDVLYLLENDYIHDQDWIKEVFNAYSSEIQFDYLSLYDHPDRYKIPGNYKNSELFISSSRHWITAPSTCGTFFVRFDIFLRDFKYLYSTKPDHLMFEYLTKKKGRRLITPVPGLSVHSMSDHLDTVQKFELYFLK